jgi:hypothetical protein
MPARYRAKLRALPRIATRDWRAFVAGRDAGWDAGRSDGVTGAGRPASCASAAAAQEFPPRARTANWRQFSHRSP